jgi:O-antigen ligase
LADAVIRASSAVGMSAAVPRRSPLVFVAGAAAVYVMAAFFTNVATFLSLTERSPIPPLAWILIAFAGSAVCIIIPESLRLVLRSPIVPWCIAFVTIVVLSYLLWSSQSEIALETMRQRIVAAVAIVCFMILFAPPAARRVARWAMIPLTLLIVPIEIFDLLHPLVLSNNIGRAAGLYINPNICGEALTVGALFGHGVLKPRWRPLFIAVAGFGVVLTLSRGGILTFVAIVIILVVQRRVSARGLFAIGAVVVGALLVFLQATGRLDAVVNAVKLLSVASERVLNVEKVAGGGDASAADRVLLAQAAAQMFEDHPFLGKGTGATNEWEYPIGPHNMYLLLAAEYGLLGLFLYPLLVLVICWRTRGPDRSLAWPTAVFFLLLGLFSHNVVGNWPDLVGIAMAVAMMHPGSLEMRESASVPILP